MSINETLIGKPSYEFVKDSWNQSGIKTKTRVKTLSVNCNKKPFFWYLKKLLVNLFFNLKKLCKSVFKNKVIKKLHYTIGLLLC